MTLGPTSVALGFRTCLVRFQRQRENMQITRAAEYGVLGLIALARRSPGEVVMIDTLCTEENVPPSFLGKIFQSLAKAGIVKSARGSGGGFSLARPPGEVSALDIIEAVEGPIALQRCLDLDEGCEHSRGCALCGLLTEAQDRIKDVFAGTSLAELAGRHIPNSLVRHARDKGHDTAGAGCGEGCCCEKGTMPAPAAASGTPR